MSLPIRILIGIALRRHIAARIHRPGVVIGTDIGELIHIIRNGQARKAVASGQSAGRDLHIVRSQASRRTAIDLCAINGNSELLGIDDLRRAVGDIVVICVEGGIFASFKLYLIDTLIGIRTISSLLASAELCGVQVLAGCSSRFRGGSTGRIGPLIGRIAAGRRVRHKIRQRSAVCNHGLTILCTSACDRIRSARIATGTLALDVDGQGGGIDGESMRAITDDIVVIVVIQYIETIRLAVGMLKGCDLISIFRRDIRRQRDGAAGIRTVDVEIVAVDFRLVICIALDIGVPADLASLAVAILARSVSIVFKGLQHLLDIVLIEDAVCCLAVGKVTSYGDIVLASCQRSVCCHRIALLTHGIAIVALAGDGDGQGQWVDLEGTVVDCNLAGSVGRRL